MALLPYSVRQVTHRNKGKGRGDREGRDTRDLAPMPETGAPREAPGISDDISDDAIEIAALIPGAKFGSIEVRPIWEM